MISSPNTKLFLVTCDTHFPNTLRTFSTSSLLQLPYNSSINTHFIHLFSSILLLPFSNLPTSEWVSFYILFGHNLHPTYLTLFFSPFVTQSNLLKMQIWSVNHTLYKDKLKPLESVPFPDKSFTMTNLAAIFRFCPIVQLNSCHTFTYTLISKEPSSFSRT